MLTIETGLTLLVLGQTTKIGKLFLTLWKLGGGGMHDKTLLAEDVPRVIFHSESLHFPERTLCNSFNINDTNKTSLKMMLCQVFSVS